MTGFCPTGAERTPDSGEIEMGYAETNKGYRAYRAETRKGRWHHSAEDIDRK